MKCTEIDEYVYHYVTEDRTQSAIMLSGDWGIGKSYYVQHELIPYLEKDGDEDSVNDRKKYKCIYISLYGLNNVSDISKKIYMAVKFGGHKDSFISKLFRGRKGQDVAVIAKTVLQSMVTYSGIDLEKIGKNLTSLYNNVDMRNALIIIEDLERTQIDIFELLGYINSLVEQDGVKVLLVANEDKFINFVSGHKKEYTEESRKYLKTKEKTISDTIRFENDKESCIRSIINSYNNTILSTYLNSLDINKIISIMKDIRNYNLRSFRFACQKTVDIYDLMKKATMQADEDFHKCVFFSIVAFSLRLKTDEEIKWYSDKYSFNLGTKEYPLFYFCYNYIVKQIFDKEKAQESIGLLRKIRLYDKEKSRNDPDLLILYNYEIQEGKKIFEAVVSIKEKLKKQEIAFSEYGHLAMALICINSLINININSIKQIMKKNVQGKESDIQLDEWYSPGKIEGDDNPKNKKKYEVFIHELIDSLFPSRSLLHGFDYSPKSIVILKRNIEQTNIDELKQRGFLCEIDIMKLIETIKHCSANEILLLNQTLNCWLKSYDEKKDKQSFQALLERLRSIENYSEFDAIQKYQFRRLLDNLASFALG